MASLDLTQTHLSCVISVGNPNRSRAGDEGEDSEGLDGVACEDEIAA